MSDLNDPRVLMAAERTALAWLRTALTMAAFGVMLERFALFLFVLKPDSPAEIIHSSQWIGASMLLVSMLVSLAGALQYRAVLKTVRPAEIPPGYRLWLPTALCIGTAFLAALLAVRAIPH